MEKKSGHSVCEAVIRRACEADMEEIWQLVGDVFEEEQGIPRALNPIPPENCPQWWCAEAEGRIVGAMAAFVEDGSWHVGRLAVSGAMRGRHIATGLMKTVAASVFDQGADCIYMEARDITVAIVKKLGGRVTGEPVLFYGERLTPAVLERGRFENADSGSFF